MRPTLTAGTNLSEEDGYVATLVVAHLVSLNAVEISAWGIALDCRTSRWRMEAAVGFPAFGSRRTWQKEGGQHAVP